MKRVISILACMFIMFQFCACGGSEEDVVGANEVISEIYSQQDISDAIDTVKSTFAEEWSGCTLNEISYAGDKYSKKYQEFADRNEADEVIVFLSSFYVAESCEIGALNKDYTYENFNWILVRNAGDNWKLVDWGY